MKTRSGVQARRTNKIQDQQRLDSCLLTCTHICTTLYSLLLHFFSRLETNFLFCICFSYSSFAGLTTACMAQYWWRGVWSSSSRLLCSKHRQKEKTWVRKPRSRLYTRGVPFEACWRGENTFTFYQLIHHPLLKSECYIKGPPASLRLSDLNPYHQLHASGKGVLTRGPYECHKQEDKSPLLSMVEQRLCCLQI